MKRAGGIVGIDALSASRNIEQPKTAGALERTIEIAELSARC